MVATSLPRQHQQPYEESLAPISHQNPFPFKLLPMPANGPAVTRALSPPADLGLCLAPGPGPSSWSSEWQPWLQAPPGPEAKRRGLGRLALGAPETCPNPSPRLFTKINNSARGGRCKQEERRGHSTVKPGRWMDVGCSVNATGVALLPDWVRASQEGLQDRTMGQG